jgi:hypothetical protein
MVNYIIIHNKHEGCYDFQCYEDEVTKMRLTSITINPPKIYLFNTKEQAQEFFEEYINDVDVLDIRCKKGDEVEHIDYCTCGIIELDDDENPVLFYNKKNQIFLMEDGPKIFLPPQELKNDAKNLNLTNKLIRKCKTLSKEQRKRYVELGKYCEDCLIKEQEEEEDKNDIFNEIIETEDNILNQVIETEDSNSFNEIKDNIQLKESEIKETNKNYNNNKKYNNKKYNNKKDKKNVLINN